MQMFGNKNKTENSGDTRFINLDGFEYARISQDGTIRYSRDFTVDQMDALYGCYLDKVPTQAIAYPEISPIIMMACGVAWINGRKLYYDRELKKTFKYPLVEDDIYIMAQSFSHDYGQLEYTDIMYDTKQFYRHTMMQYLIELAMAGFPLLQSVEHPRIRAFTPEIILYFHTVFTRTPAGGKDFKKLIKMLEKTYTKDSSGKGKYHMTKEMTVIMRKFCYETGVCVPGDEMLRVCLNRARITGSPLLRLPKELKTDFKFTENQIGQPLKYDFIDPVWVGPKHESTDGRGEFEPAAVVSRIL